MGCSRLPYYKSEGVEIQEEEASKATEIPETIPDTMEGLAASAE